MSITTTHATGVGVRIKSRSRRPWVPEGNCYLPPDADLRMRAKHTDQFYPTRNTRPGDRHRAKSVCDDCPVRAECLAYSITNWESYGIWGGETETERRVTRKAWQKVNEQEQDFDPVAFAEWWLARTD